MTPRNLRLTSLLLALACTVGCDQTSKHLARVQLRKLGAVALPGGIGELRLAENPGSFLSLGASLPEPLRTAIFTLGVGAGLLVLFAYMARRDNLKWVPFVALTLVMAGGMSNLVDRVTRKGLVTDFIVIRVGPLQTGVFNGADVMVMVGVVMLAWTLRKRRLSDTQEVLPGSR
jgi:signal peptidase II